MGLATCESVEQRLNLGGEYLFRALRMRGYPYSAFQLCDTTISYEENLQLLTQCLSVFGMEFNTVQAILIFFYGD